MAQYPIEGGCDCSQLRYAVLAPPIRVHACHCRWCQRETGASFALNACIEASNIKFLAGEPEATKVASQSGRGQIMFRCPSCRIAVISQYGGQSDLARVVRVGTLDNPDLMPPDAHIYTSTKQPWIVLGKQVPAFEEGYDTASVWPEETRERYRKTFGREAGWW